MLCKKKQLKRDNSIVQSPLISGLPFLNIFELAIGTREPTKKEIREAIERNDQQFFSHHFKPEKADQLLSYKLDKFDTNVLHWTAKHRSLRVCMELVNKFKLNVNTPNSKGMYPIHFLVINTNFNTTCEQTLEIAKKSQKAFLDFLIEKNASLNIRDKKELTALNYAALKNNQLATEELIARQKAKVTLIVVKNNSYQSLKNYQYEMNLCRSLVIACEYESLDVALQIARLDEVDKNVLSGSQKNIYHLISKISKNTNSGKVTALFEKILEKQGAHGLDKIDAGGTGMNVLHLAILNKHLGIVRLLSEKGHIKSLNVSTSSSDWDCPIHLAARSNSIECFDLLKEQGFNISALNRNGENILHVSVAYQSTELIEQLLGRQELVTQVQELAEKQNVDNLTPLELATQLGFVGLALLLEKSTNLARLEFKFWPSNLSKQTTLFHDSVQNGRLDSLEFLFYALEKKFSNQPDEKVEFLRDLVSSASQPSEDTIFHLAAKTSHPGILKCLLNNCEQAIEGRLLFKNRDELTWLHVSCLQGDQETVRFLLEQFLIANAEQKKLLLSSSDAEFNSPLHLACKNNHEAVVRTLIEAGADIQLKNMNDQSPFHVCCERSNLTILKLLFETAQARKENVAVDWQMIELVVKRDDAQLFAYLSGFDLNHLERPNTDGVLSLAKKHDIFDLAFNKKSMSILETMIRDSDEWMSFLGLDSNDSVLDYSRFKSLVKHMPNLVCLILDKFVSSEKSSLVYNFAFLDPMPKSVNKDLENHPLYIISKTSDAQVLNHKVVNKLIKLKWNGEHRFLNSTPIIFFALNFVLFFVYLISITMYVVFVNNSLTDLADSIKPIVANWSSNGNSSIPIEKVNLSDLSPEGNQSLLTLQMLVNHTFSPEHAKYLERQPAFIAVSTVYYTFCVVCLIKMLVVQALKIKFSLKNVYTLEYVLEMGAYISSTLYVINILVQQSEGLFALGPFVLILNWTVLVIFIEKIPVFGIFALMLKKILIQSVKLLPLLVIMLMGFSFGLSIIRQERIMLNSIFETFLGTMEAMIDLSSEDEYKQTYPAGFVFFLFMLMICLVLLNLFIGIAIGEIESVYEEADVKQHSVQLKFCLRIQFFLYSESLAMSYRIYTEERQVKTSQKSMKFGHKHFNYKQERESQERSEKLMLELKAKVDRIFDRLEAKSDKNEKN